MKGTDGGGDILKVMELVGVRGKNRTVIPEFCWSFQGMSSLHVVL
jgi:hypothetical protein